MAYLLEKPSQKATRLFLISGAALFLPIYLINYLLIIQILDINTLSKLLTIVNKVFLQNMIHKLVQKGQLEYLCRSYILNIVASIAFGLFLFSLNLIIARFISHNFKTDKNLFKPPKLTIFVVIFDILPSTVFLMIIQNPDYIRKEIILLINVSFFLKMIFLGPLLLWLLITGLILIRIKHKKT